ncbi:CAP domain-containing protein [Pseudovibrio sp. SPO723]|uniref:CAP domain-containing protein n=1 Tax=Nesiotobacter zosterae TaxID=392721 RepID=UPI0029C2F056|nr:CAP domain-containing protein [Pseudovibrio sp. SPO723]MDX5594935.1 CAP domain-containing protein [Pseudovibrio sp. SPO723]
MRKLNWKLPALFAAMSMVLGACAIAPDEPAYYRSLEASDAMIDQQVAAQMISGYREQHGLGPVRVDAKLTSLAEAKAKDLAVSGGSNVSGREGEALARRMSQIGEGDTYAVENTSAGYRRWAEAFSGWRDSPKHQAVMLDPDITRIGIATAYAPSSKYKVFWSMIAASD